MPTFSQRIQLVLPPWWGTAHPVLNATVAGYAVGLQRNADQITALRPFMRLDTATGELLDIAALDFYGHTLARHSDEQDNAFRARIKANLFKVKGVRWAFEQQVATLTQAAPIVIDPRRPQDTGYMGNVASGAVPTVFCNTVRHDCVTSFKIGYQWFVRITNRNNLYSPAALLEMVAALMPAGTVCWSHVTQDTVGVYYRGIAVNFNGQRLTYGAT